MEKREIKCPQCGMWTIWNERLSDRCTHCNELLELKKLNKLAIMAERKAAEEQLEKFRTSKQNPILSKATNYASFVFISIILGIISLVVLVAG